MKNNQFLQFLVFVFFVEMIMISCTNVVTTNKIKETKKVKTTEKCCVVILKELPNKQIDKETKKDADFIETYSDFTYYASIFIDSIVKLKKCEVIRIQNPKMLSKCQTKVEINIDYGIIFIKNNKSLRIEDIYTDLDYFDAYNNFFFQK